MADTPSRRPRISSFLPSQSIEDQIEDELERLAGRVAGVEVLVDVVNGVYVFHLVELTDELLDQFFLAVVLARHERLGGEGVADEVIVQGVEAVVGRAVATAGQAAIFAGTTVVTAILGLSVAGVPFLTAAGVATSVIAAIMVVASVTLLPAFLGLAGHRINRFSLRHRSDDSAAVSPGWQRWGDHVSKHAWPYAIGVTVFLLSLTAPVLALQLGFPDSGTLPETRTERRAYDLVADGFGAGTNGPLVMAIDTSEVDDPAVELVQPLAAAISADTGVASVLVPPAPNGGAEVSTIVAFPTTSPQDAATYETVQRLRAEIFPEALSSLDHDLGLSGLRAR